MNKTNIEYLDYTWNPLAMRCRAVSEGCAHCWHLGMADRLRENPMIKSTERDAYAGHDTPIIREKEIKKPIATQVPGRIGVQFMGDLFYEGVGFDQIHRIFDVMWRAERHTFLVLTKRPERMFEFMTQQGITGMYGNEWPLRNVWLGVTAENQARADERIPILLQIPAAVRFVSVEPMLGPVDLVNIQTGTHWINALNGNSQYVSSLGPMLDWVICGGESGPCARPMHPDWARSLRDQCRAAGLPFMFKQWGEWEVAEGEELGRFGIEDRYPGKAYQYIDCQECGIGQDAYGNVDESVWNRWFVRTGKKSAGRLLAGQVWDQYPEAK